ncbi:MAG: phytoene/squalene synthase family protein [Flavobacterium sp.]|nr:phytoene/squalene synthase family protein [Flavobacterium sp.]
MKALFDTISVACSKNITQVYSTSFSLGIKFLAPPLRNPIYSIYGYVRLADEIVDSFDGYRQADMLARLRSQTYEAIEEKISLNPVLNSFQQVVHQYNITSELIDSFLDSMEMDLHKITYTSSTYEKYIYGSAEAVGLMCLKVFCNGNNDQYEDLKYNAMKLGAAFQKINFLRDIKADFQGLGRMYFPETDFNAFCNNKKNDIETDIEADFAEGMKGIKKLPKDARFGVFLAYIYFKGLLKKIKATPAERIMETRIRIATPQKISLLVGCCLRNNLRMI